MCVACALHVQVDVAQYYMGLIDVLQEWNASKRIERWAKIVLKGRWKSTIKNGMSAIEPNAYHDRFLRGIGYQMGLTPSEVLAAAGSSTASHHSVGGRSGRSGRQKVGPTVTPARFPAGDHQMPPPGDGVCTGAI